MSRLGDTLDTAFDRLGEPLDDDVDIYQPSESYAAGDGYTVTYPDVSSASPDATVQATVEDPEQRPDRDEGGTTTDADLVLYVADDTGVTFSDFGTSGDAPPWVVPPDGVVYVVQAVTDENTGQLRVECVER